MSAQDAQNMYSVDPNVLVDQYRLKFSESSHRELLLENALTRCGAELEEARRQIVVLQEQLDALTPNEAEPRGEAGGMEATHGSLGPDSTSD